MPFSLKMLAPAVLALAGVPAAMAAAPAYPAAARTAVEDDYFGTKVPDPYRWLEDVDAPETLAWVKAQQAFTTPLIEALPERKSLQERLKVLWNYPRQSAPLWVKGSRYYLQNDGLQNQAVLMVQTGDEPARVLLDPNLAAADGTTALTQWEVSPSGRYLAYLMAEAGSDWETLRVRDIASGKDLPDVVSRVKFSDVAWTHDEQALLYSRYPRSANAEQKTFDKLENHGLYLHRLGTAEADDVLIYQPEDAQWNTLATITKDGRYAVVHTVKGATRDSRVHIYDLGDAKAPVFPQQATATLGADFANSYQVIGNQGSQFIVQTNQAAARQRVVMVDLKKPAPKHWRSIVPEGRDVIAGTYWIGGQLLVQRLRDARGDLSRYSLGGKRLGSIALPGIGDVSDIRGEADHSEAYFQFTGFATPASTYALTMKTGALRQVWAPQLPFSPADYHTEQRFYRSKDGTRVPMFISYKKGLKRDGSNPTLLYGYGGFNIALTPTYSPQNLAWMERGGIYAQPSLRGGSEYGAAWHAAGTKERKQNVFDDFAAAAKFLIAQRYTSAKHLGIHGRSNGGLLVGATLNQNPDLFAAAVPGVGVMDMLRFHLPNFTIGHAWRGDYGSSETAAGFGYLYPYSPLHNVRPGVQYPPTLTITADHDDRVVPGHSFKYAATMQWANASNLNPQLIRIEERGGHGAGKPVAKKIEEVADVLAFLRHYTR